VLKEPGDEGGGQGEWRAAAWGDNILPPKADVVDVLVKYCKVSTLAVKNGVINSRLRFSLLVHVQHFNHTLLAAACCCTNTG
jgi:hypothetical protein